MTTSTPPTPSTEPVPVTNLITAAGAGRHPVPLVPANAVCVQRAPGGSGGCRRGVISGRGEGLRVERGPRIAGRTMREMSRGEMERLAVSVVAALEGQVTSEIGAAMTVLERAFPLIPQIEDRVFYTQLVAGLVLAMLREIDVLGVMHVTIVADPPERVQ